MNKREQDEISYEIMQFTLKIENEKPALYELLSETPLFQSPQNIGLKWNDFSEYLESLKKQYHEFGNTNKSSVCY